MTVLRELGAEVLATGRRSDADLGAGIGYREMSLDGCVNDYEWIAEFAPAYVLHLAFPPDKPATAEAEHEFALVVGGSIRFLSFVSWLPGVQAITVAGSIKEFGRSPAPFRPEQPIEPTSPFGAAKAAITAFAGYARAARDVPINVIRLSTVYGPGQPPGSLVAQACESAIVGQPVRITGGAQVREFLYVDDAVDALIQGLFLAGAAGPGRFNVGSGEPSAVLELVRRIVALSGNEAPVEVGAITYRPSEVMDMRVDSSLFRSAANWQASTGLDDGLARTLRFYREQQRD